MWRNDRLKKINFQKYLLHIYMFNKVVHCSNSYQKMTRELHFSHFEISVSVKNISNQPGKNNFHLRRLPQACFRKHLISWHDTLTFTIILFGKKLNRFTIHSWRYLITTNISYFHKLSWFVRRYCNNKYCMHFISKYHAYKQNRLVSQMRRP